MHFNEFGAFFLCEKTAFAFKFADTGYEKTGLFVKYDFLWNRIKSRLIFFMRDSVYDNYINLSFNIPMFIDKILYIYG